MMPSAKTEIWDSIKLDDDDERQHLLQLRELVISKAEKNLPREEYSVLDQEKRTKFDVDVGGINRTEMNDLQFFFISLTFLEVITRDTVTSNPEPAKKKKKKRAKKRKLDETN